jgi:hypothetical protein
MATLLQQLWRRLGENSNANSLFVQRLHRPAGGGPDLKWPNSSNWSKRMRYAWFSQARQNLAMSQWTSHRLTHFRHQWRRLAATKRRLLDFPVNTAMWLSSLPIGRINGLPPLADAHHHRARSYNWQSGGFLTR